MEIEPDKGEKIPWLKELRKSVFPGKDTDNPIVKLSKDAGFIVFIILIVCVSLGITIGIMLAL